jgi:RNase H-like domain found in reverse transcriptase/Integrase zinc binding domain/Integrase core domain
MLSNHTIQCHPKKDWDVILMTDASEHAWGAILVQVQEYNSKINIGEQQPEPLSFLSGVFKKAQKNWSTPEKEAFALVESVEKLRHFLVRPQGFVILTDHRNLIFMYKLDSVKRLNVQAKIDRWGMKLDGYRYKIEHVAGVNNLWSDLLSRWGAAASTTTKICRLTRHRRHVAQPIVAPVHEISFPTIDEFRNLQKSASPSARDIVFEDGVYKRRGKIWIPPEARVLIMTIAHYGIAGHYGVESTMQKLREVVNWQHMLTDVKQFIMDCILCRCAKGVQPTRTHLGIQYRPKRPNQMLHFDFYYVGPSNMNFQYLLVLRDGFSRFILLVPSVTADAEAAVNGILDWIALFGVPSNFFSDQGPHFRNQVMRHLVKQLNVIHDFSTPYCAWANGLVERVLRDIKALLGLMCVETRTDRQNWPKLVRNVQMAINNRPSQSLDGEAPVKVHTGIDAHNALDFYVDKNEFIPLTWTVKIVEYLARLQETLDQVHKRVYEATEKVTLQARTKALGLFQYEIGDYVLYCSVDRKSQMGKLFFQWTGPYQIIDMKSSYIFHIQDLVQKKIIVAHVDRLSFFSTDQMDVTGELTELIAREGLLYEIEDFLDILWDPDLKTYVVQTKWLGFSRQEATFEPIRHLLEQVPKALLLFLNDLFKSDPVKVKRIFEHERDAILKFITRNDAGVYDFIT